MEVSSEVRPVILMERIVYSFATCEFWSSRRPGSTEVTFDVSCENETKLIAQNTSNRERYRCMFINSVSKAIGKMQFAGQIKGKFQTVLLNRP